MKTYEENVRKVNSLIAIGKRKVIDKDSGKRPCEIEGEEVENEEEEKMKKTKKRKKKGKKKVKKK